MLLCFGSDTELNLWQPEFQQGLIILQTPQAMIDRKAELLADED
jgi:hypothetical protein